MKFTLNRGKHWCFSLLWMEVRLLHSLRNNAKLHFDLQSYHMNTCTTIILKIIHWVTKKSARTKILRAYNQRAADMCYQFLGPQTTGTSLLHLHACYFVSMIWKIQTFLLDRTHLWCDIIASLSSKPLQPQAGPFCLRRQKISRPCRLLVMKPSLITMMYWRGEMSVTVSWNTGKWIKTGFSPSSATFVQ